MGIQEGYVLHPHRRHRDGADFVMTIACTARCQRPSPVIYWTNTSWTGLRPSWLGPGGILRGSLNEGNVEIRGDEVTLLHRQILLTT